MSYVQPLNESNTPHKPNASNSGSDDIVEINGVPYRKYLDIKYSWSTIRGKDYKDGKRLTVHPWFTDLRIYCFSHKTIDERLQGIQFRLEMVSYYTCGPCGLYADIRGHVAGQHFKGRAVMTGTGKNFFPVQPIQVPGYIVTIKFDFWSLNVLIQAQVFE